MKDKKLEFKLSKIGKPLRWLNWESFVDKYKSVFNGRRSEFCVLFVCCNSFESFKRCNEYLQKESNQNFDILIVDNSTDDENIKLFHDVGLKNDKISILRPVDNIGGSGGFSIGIEYVIANNYNYIILFEDDIIPMDDDIISNVIKLAAPNKLVFNRNMILGDGLPFHLNCYPTQFFKECGVVDPRMFLTYDDVEISGIINREIRSGKYKKISTDKTYYHPLFKKNGQKCRTLYLASRNLLIKCMKINSITNVKEFILGFMGLFYGFSKGFIEGCWSVLYSHILGVLDFILGKYRFADTQSRLKGLFGLSISIPDGIITKDIPESKMQEFMGDKLDLFWKLTGGHNCLGNIKCSNKFRDRRKNGLVVAGFKNNLYPFFVLSKNVVCLDGFDFDKKEYQVSFYNSKFSKFYIIYLILSFILSVLLYIPLYLVAFIKILMCKVIVTII